MEDTEPIFLDKELEKVHDVAENLLGGQIEEEEFILPPRVRIYLVLTDEEGKQYPFQADAVIPMRNAFEW